MNRRARLILVSVLFATGCATSQYMVAQPTQPLTAPPDRALVVFVRPSAFASAIATTILDEQGRFLGDSLPRSHFSVAVPAGRHLFIVWGENTDALDADLAAGRIYFVEVSPKLGWMSARMHLFALKPGSENWANRDAWMSDTRAFVPDVERGQQYLDGRGPDVADRIRRARENFAGYQGEELTRRTIGPADGL